MDFIFDPSLVLYLPVYELDGASFMSKDKRGHLCTVTGAVWTSQGRYFDGSDDQAIIANAPSFEISEAITVEIWVNTDTFSASAHGFIVKSPLGGGYGDWDCYQATTGEVRFVCPAIGLSVITGLLSLDTWYHLVFTYDRVNAILYQDGGPVDTQALGTALPTNGHDIYLAVFYQALASRRLNGIIGEVRIYNRALTPLEVEHNYLATKWRYR